MSATSHRPISPPAEHGLLKKQRPRMADLPEGEVVLDIDDSAERPASEHGGDSDDDDQGEAATSQQGDDDSIHLFTGHRGCHCALSLSTNLHSAAKQDD